MRDFYVKHLGHYKHLIRSTMTLIVCTCMTTSSVIFTTSTGKKEANSPRISIKQLLISAFLPIQVHIHSNTFSGKSNAHCAEDLVWSECFKIPPKFVCWNPHLHGNIRKVGSFRKCLGHKGGDFMDGISSPIKETWESSWAPSTTLRTRQVVVSLQPRRGPWPEPDLAGSLISYFQPPELWEK